MIRSIKPIALIFALILAVVVCASCAGPDKPAAESRVAPESAGFLNNPYRGFYFTSGRKLKESGNAAPEVWLYEDKERQSIVHLMFDLSAFSSPAGGTSKDISEDALSCVDAFFAQARNAGKSVIFRASYNIDGEQTDGEYNENEPELNVMLRHVEQLSQVLSRYDNLIVIQSGMLGPWGEQHGTAAAKTPSNFFEITEAWLSGVLRTDVTISVRRPLYFTYWYNLRYGTSYDAQTIDQIPAAAKGTDEYRVGVYNDGMLRDINDYGTFSTENEKIWLARQSAHTYYGGEAVLEYTPLTGAEVIARFERFHLSYLNFEYNQKEHAKWKAASYTGAREPYQKDKSVYEFIEDHMGYRFVLTKLDMPEAVTAGDTLTVNAEITNAGFAPLLKNPVSAELRIADADGNVIAMDSQSVDLNGKNIAFSVSIPENATQGQYTLFAAFDSGIRLANKDAWSIQQNANRLSVLNIQSA